MVKRNLHALLNCIHTFISGDIGNDVQTYTRDNVKYIVTRPCFMLQKSKETEATEPLARKALRSDRMCWNSVCSPYMHIVAWGRKISDKQNGYHLCICILSRTIICSVKMSRVCSFRIVWDVFGPNFRIRIKYLTSDDERLTTKVWCMLQLYIPQNAVGHNIRRYGPKH